MAGLVVLEQMDGVVLISGGDLLYVAKRKIITLNRE